MRIKKGISTIIFFLLLTGIGTYKAEGHPMQDDPADTIDTKLSRVKDLVAFLEYTLNNIGGKGLMQKEKDIIITQSYTKFFRDSEVQVEDDLDQNRSTVTNKDVQAYLKDVDFFFKNVSFKLEIEEIQQMVNDSSEIFFLVKLNRNMNGITITEDTVNQTITRFLEINYNDQDDDLKIVSYYTTKLSEKEDLMNWWNELTFEWKFIFQNKVNIFDSIGYEELKSLIELDSLNLSSNHYIQDFEPLFKLDQLTYLDLSHTNISDLSPLRIHNKLEYLDLSNTPVKDLSYLKYATNMQHFVASRTSINDVNVMDNFTKLKHLDLSECIIDSIDNFSLPPSINTLIYTHANFENYGWLENLQELTYLDLSFSDLRSTQYIGELKNLRTLVLEGTKISDLNPLTNVALLELLNIESTQVADIYSLGSLANLRKVYCDHSLVTRMQADNFMKDYPAILIIFDSDELRKWWNELSDEWKSVYMGLFDMDKNPEKDDLARITQVDSINIAGNKQITDLKGLAPLKKLRYLDFHNTFVVKANTMTTLPELIFVDGSYSNITHLDSVSYLKNLTYLNLASTKISSIDELSKIRGLKYVNLDLAAVDPQNVIELKLRNPECLIIYRSNYLQAWWEKLDDTWKDIFLSNAGITTVPDANDLHKISYLNKLVIDSANIKDLSPVNELFFLKELYINRTAVKDVSPLPKNDKIEKLSINQSPVLDISVLNQLHNLKHLDISNTGIADIDILADMDKLEIIKLSGIQIKHIKPLEELKKIRQLDISNTMVKSLTPIEENYNLEVLVCYNTKIKQKKIDDFRNLHPDCQISYY